MTKKKIFFFMLAMGIMTLISQSLFSQDPAASNFEYKPERLTNILVVVKDEIFYILPYFILAAILAAVTQTYFKVDQFKNFFSGKIGGIFVATVVAILAPVCTLSVLPVAYAFRKVGAKMAPIVAFMIVGPIINFSTMPIVYQWCGLDILVFTIIGGIILGIIVGLAIRYSIQWGLFEDKIIFIRGEKPAASGAGNPGNPGNPDSVAEGSIDLAFGERKFSLVLKRFYKEFFHLIPVLCLGIVLIGLIRTFLPVHFLKNTLNLSAFSQISLIALLSTPMHLCCSDFAVAKVLVELGASKSAVVALLLAGPAISVAGVVVFGNFLGKKAVTVATIAIIVTTIILCTLMIPIIG